jgi:hypothetical protein
MSAGAGTVNSSTVDGNNSIDSNVNHHKRDNNYSSINNTKSNANQSGKRTYYYNDYYKKKLELKYHLEQQARQNKLESGQRENNRQCY